MSNKMHKKKFLILGGDARQIKLAEKLSDCGYSVSALAQDNIKIDKVKSHESLSEAAAEANTLILPVPTLKGGGVINNHMSAEKLRIQDLADCLTEKHTVFCAMLGEEYAKLFTEKKIKLFDYSNREEFILKNAVPTAEAALEIAINQTLHTIHGCKSLVLGYGRIAKVLSSYLKHLGSFVTASARSTEAAAQAFVDSVNFVRLSELSKHINDFDIIFNTIPAKVLPVTLLVKVNPQAVIIDLASKPGGAAFIFDKSYNKNQLSVIKVYQAFFTATEFP